MVSPLENRIRALLAMAEHPNSNQNEAAIAMEKAQALLLQHNLDASQIRSDGQPVKQPTTIGKVTFVDKEGYPWKARLIHQIAKSNLCQVVQGYTGTHMIHLLGTQDNVRAVLEMYYWVSQQLVDMVAREWKAYKKTSPYADSARAFKTSFMYGAIKTIAERLRKPYEEFAQGIGTSLVVTSNKLVQDAMSRAFPNARTRSTRGSIGSGAGFGAGREAGNNVRFGKSKALTSRALPAGRGI